MDNTRRLVATLIVLLLLVRLGGWLWAKYQGTQAAATRQAAESRRIAASKAYDDALLRAEMLLARPDTAAAAHLLDSLAAQPTDSLFPIERQKLRALQQRLAPARLVVPAGNP